MSVTLSTFDPVLKELYANQKVKDLVYPDQPFYAMVPKFENFEGDVMPFPLKFENNQSISCNFKVGIRVAGNTQYGKWNMTRKRKYGFATIEGEVARASRSSKGAFLSAIRSEIDSTKKGMAASLNADLFSNGTGALAANSSTAYDTSTNVLTLASAEDVAKLHVGMKIVIYNSANSTVRVGGSTLAGTTLDASSVFDITGRDAISGSITLDADPTSIATGDLIFRAGDRGEVVSGLDFWLDPKGSTKYGLDTSSDITRLGGIHYNGSNNAIKVNTVAIPKKNDGTIEKTLVNAASFLNREGGRPDVIWVAFSDYAKLINELGTNVRYERKSPGDATQGKFGFQAVQLATPKGILSVMADQNCLENVAYILTMSSWKFISVGQPIMIDDLDGNSLLRAGDDDAVQSRLLGYGNLVCLAPGHNARVLLPDHPAVA